MNIHDYWSLSSPERATQTAALDWLAENKHKKYIFMQLPVGAGKSGVAVTFARYMHAVARSGLRAAYILTPQKILQEQYVKSFITESDVAFAANMQGQATYTCSTKKTTCKNGALSQPPCLQCPYKLAKKHASASEVVITNYAYLLSFFSFIGNDCDFQPRDVIVYDECHTVENTLTEYGCIGVSKATCLEYGIKYNKFSNIGRAFEWLENTYYPACEIELERLEAECEGYAFKTQSQLTKYEAGQLNLLIEHTQHISALVSFFEMGEDIVTDNYVLVQDDDSLKFKSLYGSDNFSRLLADNGTSHLFMSATIFDYKIMCQNLGIPADQAAFYDAPSEFPVENRPVVYAPTIKMTYGWNSNENAKMRRDAIVIIKNILAAHSGDNGIVQTGSFQIAQWLVDELSNNKTHVVIHHNPKSNIKREDAIDNFQTSRVPVILISPSITEGLDLHDDLARFCIIAKVPFASLGDAWVKTRMGISQRWYDLETIKGVLQGCGRVVRHNKDEGITYIIDSSWGALYSRMKSAIPQWWHDAYDG